MILQHMKMIEVHWLFPNVYKGMQAGFFWGVVDGRILKVLHVVTGWDMKLPQPKWWCHNFMLLFTCTRYACRIMHSHAHNTCNFLFSKENLWSMAPWNRGEVLPWNACINLVECIGCICWHILALCLNRRTLRCTDAPEGNRPICNTCVLWYIEEMHPRHFWCILKFVIAQPHLKWTHKM